MNKEKIIDGIITFGIGATIVILIVFGERQLKRNQTVAFKTESFGVIEILSLDDLKEVRL